jgi:hypothetical protein
MRFGHGIAKGLAQTDADTINLLDLYNSLAGGNGDYPIIKNEQPGSPADAWLEQLTKNWSHDLKTISLLDLCKLPTNLAKQP